MTSTISIGHQLKVLVTVVLMLAVIGGGWVLAVQPALAAAFAAEDSRTEVSAQNDAIRAEIAALETAKGELPGLEADLKKLNASIPVTAESSALLEQIDALADKAGVVVDGVTLEEPQPYLPPAAPAAAETTEAEGADAADAVADAAAAASTDPLQPFTDPRITPANLVLVPVSVAVSGSFGDVLDFVHNVQTGPRLFLVNSFSSAADAEGDGSTVTATVAGFVYVLLGEA
jgi:Tfp pilus assembly protein PilO